MTLELVSCCSLMRWRKGTRKKGKRVQRRKEKEGRDWREDRGETRTEALLPEFLGRIIWEADINSGVLLWENCKQLCCPVRVGTTIQTTAVYQMLNFREMIAVPETSPLSVQDWFLLRAS